MATRMIPASVNDTLNLKAASNLIDVAARATAEENLTRMKYSTPLANDFTMAATALADVTGASVAVDANKTYGIEVIGSWSTNNTAGQVNVTLSLPSGATIDAIRNVAIANGNLSNIGILASDGGTLATAIGTANTRCPLRITGIVKTGGTSGNIQIRCASGSASHTAKVYAGIVIRRWEIL